jgi:hypothetical protein
MRLYRWSVRLGDAVARVLAIYGPAKPNGFEGGGRQISYRNTTPIANLGKKCTEDKLLTFRNNRLASLDIEHGC